jgi:hypothetical protein
LYESYLGWANIGAYKWRKALDRNKANGTNPIVGHSITNEVAAKADAAVIFQLMIALQYRLSRDSIGPGHQSCISHRDIQRIAG